MQPSALADGRATIKRYPRLLSCRSVFYTLSAIKSPIFVCRQRPTVRSFSFRRFLILFCDNHGCQRYRRQQGDRRARRSVGRWGQGQGGRHVGYRRGPRVQVSGEKKPCSLLIPYDDQITDRDKYIFFNRRLCLSFTWSREILTAAIAATTAITIIIITFKVADARQTALYFFITYGFIFFFLNFTFVTIRSTRFAHLYNSHTGMRDINKYIYIKTTTQWQKDFVL